MARRRGQVGGSGRTARTVLVVALAAALAAPAAGWVSVQASSAAGSYDPTATGGDVGGGTGSDAGADSGAPSPSAPVSGPTPSTSSASSSPAPAGFPSAAADAGRAATEPAAAPASPRLRVVDATRPLPAAPAAPAPARLRVPSLGIDAPVDAVGVLPDGTAEIPEDAQRVGWYRFGPVPGADRGAAVLVGHRDARGQGPGALYGLVGIGVGDSLTVTRRDGSAVTYRVVERRRWEKQAVPLDRLYARSGPPRLVVITCGGAYDPDRGGYQDNVVVTAVPAR